jgi:hypothetical protein
MDDEISPECARPLPRQHRAEIHAGRSHKTGNVSSGSDYIDLAAWIEIYVDPLERFNLMQTERFTNWRT